MSGLLELQHITAGYGKKTIVRNISMELRPGELCALLGLNGSGKTTLLKCVCGLLPIQEGRCLANGLDCTNLNEYKRARYISYIPQRHSKMQGVAVHDVVLMGRNAHLGIISSPSHVDREQAMALLERFGIAHLLEQDFSKLSEGQKQLVMLARALMQDSPVMLMDEPDSALDFLNRNRMLDRISGLIHSDGKAGLITLHDPNLALAYCDRLLLLQNGEIAAEFMPKEASVQDIQYYLSIIYGNVTVLDHNGRYNMLLN